jgi:hypothetical protein
LIGEKRVAIDFLRVGKDTIQTIEKSMCKPLIGYDREYSACGFQYFDASRGGEKKRRERVE